MAKVGMTVAAPMRGFDRGDARALAAIGGAGIALDLLCRLVPADLPPVAPFIFNVPLFLLCTLGPYWYWRGVAALAPEARPGLWRHVVTFGGFALIYAVTLTRFEYIAQHMFFLNRTQQVALGAFAPFLIALGWPRDAFAAGIPAPLLGLVAGRRMRALRRNFGYPPTAALLWVAVTDLWLIPPVHFAAMLDPLLYQVMNLAMIAAGLWFWSSVLDPRPRAEAGSSYLTRMASGFLVMFPQILVASTIAFSATDLYAFYALCGRLFPGISPLQDQLGGGIIQWFPPGALNTAVLFVQLGAIRRSEDKASREIKVPEGARVIEARWTGR